MIRMLGVALLFGLIFGLARSFGRPARSEEAQEMVQDALTRVYFPKSAAVKVVRGGETLHFQSLENRDLFLSRNR
ncbi:MAG: hypothetical protein LBC90_03690 [Candidatus Adiutrix sp.]|jgi:hypothetical protein|nr:hypothetical protein [Candidatus Adiutrix sp.]